MGFKPTPHQLVNSSSEWLATEEHEYYVYNKTSHGQPKDGVIALQSHSSFHL
jgi:hypothetical protein